MRIIPFIVLLVLSTSCLEATKGKREKEAKQNNRNEKKCEETNTCDRELAKTNSEQRSMLFRDKGSKIYSYSELANLIVEDKLPDTHRLVTDPAHDIDSEVGQSANIASDCGHGSELTTVKERITHCQKTNKDSASWNGEDNGIAGEGNWALVYHFQGRSVWLDESTNLLWSFNIKSDDWHKASETNAKDSKMICSNLNVFNKDEVKWKLPNRNEFLQADLNGARFVLRETSQTYWTASSSAVNVSDAWSIKQDTGVLALEDKNTEHNIRCVGYIIK